MKSAISSLTIATLTLSFMAFSSKSLANGYNDFMTAITALSETSSVKGTISLSIDETRGEKGDEDYEQTTGSIVTMVNYSKDGLSIAYNAETMQQLEQDFVDVAADENAKTPTLKGLNELRTRDITSLLSQSQRLLSLLKGASLISESEVEFKGQPARELLFKLPLEAIVNDEKTRGYVDKFKSDYRVIIDQNGFPLASTLNYDGKGRAYIVLSFRGIRERYDEYQVIGDRLVNVYSRNTSSYDSTFGKGSVSMETQFKPADISLVSQHQND